MQLIEQPQLAPSPGEMLSRLAGPCARYGLDPQRVGDVRAQWLLALDEHERREAGLRESIGSKLGSVPNLRASDDHGRHAAQEWQEDVRQLQLELAEETCCWGLPLDHRYGELLQSDKQGRPAELRRLEHWENAAQQLRYEAEQAWERAEGQGMPQGGGPRGEA